MQTGRVRFVLALAGALTASAALTSCATLDEKQCTSVDWRQLGEDNGAHGQPSDFVERHVDACSRYNLPVDRTSWREGWEVGIRRYCTPQNGLNEGRAGHSYAGSCPPEVAFGFEDAYRAGKAVHDAEQDRPRIEGELDALRDKRDASKDEKERGELDRQVRQKEDDLRAALNRQHFAERDYDRYIYEHQLNGY